MKQKVLAGQGRGGCKVLLCSMWQMVSLEIREFHGQKKRTVQVRVKRLMDGLLGMVGCFLEGLRQSICVAGTCLVKRLDGELASSNRRGSILIDMYLD